MAPTTSAEIRTDFTVESIPAELRQRAQWVCWRIEIRRDRSGQLRATKVPVDPDTGRNASATEPATWADFDTAVRFARRHHLGIGYVFAADDPYTGVDLDKCRDPRTGAIAAWARAVILLLDSYSEVSPSETGVKVFICGALLDAAGKRRGPVELYSRARFFTVTGRRLTDVPGGVMGRQPQLDALVRKLFPPPAPAVPKRRNGAVVADDAELIARAIKARNGAKFSRLWRGEWAGHYTSQSEADAALVAILGHWTNYDPARVDVLFRRSGLCRPKWTDRADYVPANGRGKSSESRASRTRWARRCARICTATCCRC